MTNTHAFVNSDTTKFDSNCSACGGKQRDSIHNYGPQEESRAARNLRIGNGLSIDRAVEIAKATTRN